MDEFDTFDNPFVPYDYNGIDMGFNPLMCDMDWMDLQFDSFARGDDLYAMNEAIVNNPNFQSLPHPTFVQDIDNGGVIVTDIFGGQHHYTSMEQANICTDVMSGMPTSNFQSNPISMPNNENDTSDVDNRSVERIKLDRSEELEHERDSAVEKYHNAINRNDYEEALEWENIARDKEEAIRTLWDTPRYTSDPVKVQGID